MYVCVCVCAYVYVCVIKSLTNLRLRYFSHSAFFFVNHSLSPFVVVAFIHSNIGARGVMVIDVGKGHGETSSNPGRD